MYANDVVLVADTGAELKSMGKWWRHIHQGGR